MKEIIKRFRFFIYKQIKIPLIDLLKGGTDPQKLSLAVSLGFVIGIFPVIGTTTILCALAAFIFRLNMAAIQLINYLVYPLQLALIVPYIKLGAFFLGKDHYVSLSEVINKFKIGDLVTNFDMVVHILTGSLIVWLGISIISGFVVFKIIYPIFKKIAGTLKIKMV